MRFSSHNFLSSAIGIGTDRYRPFEIQIFGRECWKKLEEQADLQLLDVKRSHHHHRALSTSESILEYHPQMLQEYLHGEEHISFVYPSGIDRFKQQFVDLEEQEGKGGRNSPLRRQYTSLPRADLNEFERRTNASIATTLRSPPRSSERTKNVNKKDSKNIPNPKTMSRSSSINSRTQQQGLQDECIHFLYETKTIKRNHFVVFLETKPLTENMWSMRHYAGT
ncbi:hypothetical protein LXL04_007816 [Taraxacum kok-saghyz]